MATDPTVNIAAAMEAIGDHTDGKARYAVDFHYATPGVRIATVYVRGDIKAASEVAERMARRDGITIERIVPVTRVPLPVGAVERP